MKRIPDRDVFKHGFLGLSHRPGLIGAYNDENSGLARIFAGVGAYMDPLYSGDHIMVERQTGRAWPQGLGVAEMYYQNDPEWLGGGMSRADRQDTAERIHAFFKPWY
ncbi:MAG: hypothetical protein GY798_34885 [Hyphomicrobiales bacterium]|nr:hypothetical protein [Hyphomicrobiales bacterium]